MVRRYYYFPRYFYQRVAQKKLILKLWQIHFSIAIVGAGNVATNLALSLFETGVTIRSVYSRNMENTHVLAAQVNASAISSLAEVHPDVIVIAIAVFDI